MIWSSGNAYEQTCLRYALRMLKYKPNKIFVINAGISVAQDLIQLTEKSTIDASEKFQLKGGIWRKRGRWFYIQSYKKAF